MLSNLLVTQQKVVLIIDELNRERLAPKFIDGLLHEQGQEADTIKALPTGANLKHVSSFDALITECANNSVTGTTTQPGDEQAVGSPAVKPTGYNVILPTLADLLCYQPPAFIFGFLNRLRRSEGVHRVFLWASPKHLQHPDATYILAGCEYIAELVLRLETETLLSLISRKPGGGVTNKRYSCKVTKNEFHVTPLDGGSAAAAPQLSAEEEQTPEPVVNSTFKIELDEDEVVARNALTLPYERASEPSEGNIIYTPDADDDFDEEDPDEDLCI